MPRDRLIEDIWGYDFEGNERTLDVHVNRRGSGSRRRNTGSGFERCAVWVTAWRQVKVNEENAQNIVEDRWETLQTILVFAVLGASWTAATYVTRFIYTWTGTPRWDYVIQLINLFVGVIIFFLCMLVVGMFFKHRQMAMLNSITDAMRRISQGDFKVKMNENEWRGEFKMIASD